MLRVHSKAGSLPSPYKGLEAFNKEDSELLFGRNDVSEQVLERKTADQVFGQEDVVHLAWGQDEADGIAEGIDTNVYLRTQAAARTPDRLIFAPPFFAPAAC